MDEKGRKEAEGVLSELTAEVARWEASPYHIPEEELFDIERFLEDRGAGALRAELERAFGTPLNRRFFSALLPYAKLRRARREVVEDDRLHDEKRRRFFAAIEEERRALAEAARAAARPPLRVIAGGKVTGGPRPKNP